MSGDDSPHYAVRQDDGKYRVVDWTDRTILTCGNSASAEQYAVLLNQAFDRGYKEGYRAASPRDNG